MVTIQPLWAPQYLTGAAVAYYTATAARTQIDKVTVNNPSSSTGYSCSIWWVPAASTPDNSNSIVKTRFLQPLEAWDVWFLIGHTLGVGDSIQALASVANVLAFFGSGRTMTP